MRAVLLARATSKGILTNYTREPLRVLYYNAEDDQNVLNGRVAALLTQYQIDQAELVDSLYVVSGIDHDDFWLIGGVEGIINETLFAQLETFLTTNKIDVVIFDPLQDLSRSPETNEIFRSVGQRLRLMATKTQTALGLVHHTRKMQQGVTASIDDARGGSALCEAPAASTASWWACQRTRAPKQKSKTTDTISE